MLSKKLKDLKRLEKDIEVIISTTHKETYFVELRAEGELVAITNRDNEPVHYKNLEEIYEILRKYHIHKAILMQQMPYDEMIGGDSDGAQVVEMQLNF